jgi:hypothetical protein
VRVFWTGCSRPGRLALTRSVRVCSSAPTDFFASPQSQVDCLHCQDTPDNILHYCIDQPFSFYQSNMWSRYQALIKRKPLLTNMATGAAVMFFGDGAAQQLKISEDPEVKFDWGRSVCMTVWSGAIFSPTFYYWFRFLDSKFPGAVLKNVTAKVAINGVTVSPLINCVAIGYSVVTEKYFRSTVNGEDFNTTAVLDETTLRCKKEVWNVVRDSSIVWLPVNFLNFMYCPAHLRVLPSIFTSFAWNTILSTKIHRPLDDAKPQQPTIATTPVVKVQYCAISPRQSLALMKGVKTISNQPGNASVTHK